MTGNTSKIILGSAQFGLKYGINNSFGRIEFGEAVKILDYAYKNEIRYIDTAESYGNSIDTLGKFLIENNEFRIISKFINNPQFDLYIELQKVLKQLNIPNLYCYMFHRFSDMIDSPKLMDQLSSVKLEGLINNIGVSIYNNEEFEKAINNQNIDIIQTPYNLLDNENFRGELILKAKQKNKIVHARSVFLQGLFFKKKIPKNLTPLEKYIQKLKAISEQHAIKMNALALSYVLINENIDGVIIGIDSLNQLKENLQVEENLVNNEILVKINDIQVERIDLLNPTNW